MIKDLLSLAIVYLFMNMASAHCPLCTAATGSAVVVARLYGFSDAVIGIWLGAFIVSTSLWLDRSLNKQGNPLITFSLISVFLLLTLWPMSFFGVYSYATVFGIDRLAFFTVVGSVVTFIGLSSRKFLPRMFRYQILVFTLALLLLFSAMATFFWW